jgi:hypothetical protein
MKIIVCSALAAIAIAGATSPADAKGKCIRAGGQATAVTHELSKGLAEIALNNSISMWGGKGAGKISYACKYDLVLSNCTAHQRACKS